jgi:hypothetical protein
MYGNDSDIAHIFRRIAGPPELRMNRTQWQATGADQRIFGPNPKRWAILLPPHPSGRYTVEFGNIAQQDIGINILPNGPPFMAWFPVFGQAIREEIRGFDANVGFQHICYEFFG